MIKLKDFFLKNKGKTLLCIFPHPDDESFVAGGILQLAERVGINTKLICLTRGSLSEKTSGAREKELKKASEVLGIDSVILWEYIEGELKINLTNWVDRLKKEIINTKPFAILTFDPNGITGHPDHIVTCTETLKLVSHIGSPKPHIIWRLSDLEEKKFFYKDKGLVIDKKPEFEYKLSFKESVKKLKAIFCYKSQLKNPFFKFRILEWYLFDHKELYALADFKSDNIKVIFE